MTPDTSGYAIAAYVAAVLIYGGYILALRRRSRALGHRQASHPAGPRVVRDDK
jgi:hypothetical protein